jgi:hypothetical protein
MRLKAVYLTTDAYVTRRAQHTKQIVASDKVLLELDMPTASVRVDDREPGGDGVYHVPLTCVRIWFPLAEDRAVKKAANQ